MPVASRYLVDGHWFSHK